MPLKVVIIGGGASGLAAAVTAAKGGAEVTILEHKDRVGKKILMTGNGKCNLTNLGDCHGKYYGEDVGKIYSYLDKFTPQDTIAFFEEMGLYTKEKRDGGVYPVSEQATAVLDVLRSACAHLHVRILTECEPVSIKQGTVSYLEKKTQKKRISYDKLILAAGGAAAPVSGSDGSGYALARALGHHLIKPLPALVQLRCEGNYFKALSGVRAQAALTLYIDGKEAAAQEGELQLTDYGISGIPVFQFSRIAVRALEEHRQCQVKINFLPFFQPEDMECVKGSIARVGYKTMEEFLGGMTHKKIAALLCKRHQIKPDVRVEELNVDKVMSCIEELREFVVTVKASNPFENAQVCSGGVPLKEVTQQLESVYCKNVYMTGEILDCDGICGGYNLQWAWATGVLAARAALQ